MKKSIQKTKIPNKIINHRFYTCLQSRTKNLCLFGFLFAPFYIFIRLLS